MAISEILYPVDQSLPRQVPAADAASVLIALQDDEAMPTSSSPATRKRAATALLQTPPTLSSDPASKLAQMSAFLQKIIDSALTQADVPASLVGKINEVLERISALETAGETELDQLQTVISTLIADLSTTYPSMDTDLNEMVSKAKTLLNNVAQNSPELRNLLDQDTDLSGTSSTPNDPTGGRDPVAFMRFILLTSILSANYDAKNAKTTTDMSSSFIKFASQVLEKTQKDMKAYTKAVKAEHHKSWLGKVFSGIASGLLIVVGALTGQPELAAAGVLMLIMQASGGQAKLDEQLAKLPLVGKILAEVAIAVVESGGCSIAASGVKSLTTLTAQEVAAGVETGIKCTVTASGVVQQLASTQFWSDITRLTMRIGDELGAETSKSKEDLVSGITGAALGMVTSFAAVYKGATTAAALDIAERLSLSEKGLFRLKVILGVSAAAMNITSAGYNISASTVMFTEADILRSRASNESTLQICEYVTGVANSVSENIQQGATRQAQVQQDIAGRMNEIVNPWPV
jgi:hypothetical protein